MAINNNITREEFTQSQIFKNIFGAGVNMASFIGKTDVSDEQKKLAATLVTNWNDACKAFGDNETTWEKTRRKEIIADVTEYLAKAKAMAEMALDADLIKISAETFHCYFWELSSLISAAEAVFEDLQ